MVKVIISVGKPEGRLKGSSVDNGQKNEVEQ